MLRSLLLRRRSSSVALARSLACRVRSSFVVHSLVGCVDAFVAARGVRFVRSFACLLACLLVISWRQQPACTSLSREIGRRAYARSFVSTRRHSTRRLVHGPSIPHRSPRRTGTALGASQARVASQARRRSRPCATAHSSPPASCRRVASLVGLRRCRCAARLAHALERQHPASQRRYRRG